MAKKRVHEIAKERGISSKEVIAVLQGAGLDVKAAASSVDERDIRMAFSNGAEGGDDVSAASSAVATGERQPDARPSGEPQRPSGAAAGEPPAERPSRPTRPTDRGAGAGA